jgi:hypothetical protein
LFYYATSFNNGANTNVNPSTARAGLNGWNPCNVTNMGGMFKKSNVGTYAFNRPIGDWDVGKCTDFNYMFGVDVGSANKNPFDQDISAWNIGQNLTVGQTITMEAMFFYSVFNNGSNSATNPVTGRTGINGWDTSKVANMSSMFYGDTVLKRSFENWIVTACTNFSNMFNGCDINEVGTTTNYDALLVGWAAQSVQLSKSFHGGSSQYSDSGADGKAVLLAKSWTITDGGPFVVNVWKGTTSANWNTASNWTANAVPTASHSVYFESQYNNPCTINANAVARGIEIATGYTNTITQGAFTVSAGVAGWQQHDGTFNGSATGMTLTDGYIQDGGTFNAGSQTISVSGNWTVSGGTFNAQTSTISLSGTNQSIAGTTTFNNLTKTVTSAATLTFAAGNTQTVAGTMNLQGASGKLLSLRSSSEGTQWKIDPQGTRTIGYLDVKDSWNTNGSAINAVGANCTDSGNNTNWTFS